MASHYRSCNYAAVRRFSAGRASRFIGAAKRVDHSRHAEVTQPPDPAGLYRIEDDTKKGPTLKADCDDERTRLLSLQGRSDHECCKCVFEGFTYRNTTPNTPPCTR